MPEQSQYGPPQHASSQYDQIRKLLEAQQEVQRRNAMMSMMQGMGNPLTGQSNPFAGQGAPQAPAMPQQQPQTAPVNFAQKLSGIPSAASQQAAIMGQQRPQATPFDFQSALSSQASPGPRPAGIGGGLGNRGNWWAGGDPHQAFRRMYGEPL